MRLLALLLLLAPAAWADVPRLVLDSPPGGAVERGVVTISGILLGAAPAQLELVHEGLVRRVPLFDGRFAVEVALFRGANRLRLVAPLPGGTLERRLRIVARIPRPAIEVRLSWGPRADLDLIVVQPDGRRVWYADPRAPRASFAGEVRDGQGPEVYRASRLQPGRYRLLVRKAAGTTPTRALLEAVWLAGGRVERRRLTLELREPGQVERELLVEKN